MIIEFKEDDTIYRYSFMPTHIAMDLNIATLQLIAGSTFSSEVDGLILLKGNKMRQYQWYSHFDTDMVGFGVWGVPVIYYK